jgi:hypothetical protein
MVFSSSLYYHFVYHYASFNSINKHNINLDVYWRHAPTSGSEELMDPEIPEGWQAFTAALPPNLYAKLAKRAEAEEVDILTEAAYLLTAALDSIPPVSKVEVPEISEERDRALQELLRAASREAATKPTSS